MSERAANWIDARQAFTDLLAGVRRRRRFRRAAEGLALALGLSLVAALLGILIMDVARFDAQTVSTVRLVVYTVAAVSLLAFGVVHVLRPLSDRRLAYYLESRVPGLDALILSATELCTADPAEVPRTRDTSPGLGRRLVQNAIDACGRTPAVGELERPRQRRAAYTLAGLLVAASLLMILGPESLRHGAHLLFDPMGDTSRANPYVVRVMPGDISVLQGSDQRIGAVAEGFGPVSAVLVSRGATEADWQRTPMAGPTDAGAFEAFLFNLDGTRDYYVEADGMRSPVHRIEVVPRPEVARIDLRYQYPARTGRPPEWKQGGTDIRAVRGSLVDLQITPAQPAAAGHLVVDGDLRIPLRLDGDTLWATLEIERSGHYRVELPAGPLGMVPASPEYAIVAHTDTLPSIRISNPGRDTRVTRVEEMKFQVHARDDVAVRSLELVMSVNGGEEEVFPLGVGAAGAQPSIDGSHLLYLEERELVPGDLIAYYARARDAPDDSDRQVVTDMFFMDVRPFEQHFRSAGSGGGGGGGGGRGEETLAAQQRTLVVALFKLARALRGLDQAVADTRIETLGTAQQRIRGRTEAIVRRIGTRRVVDLNPAYRQMAEALPKAAAAMTQVEALLAAADLKRALPQAREALGHLQRADAAFREVQVAMGSSQGGGGAAANELANLFQLEMDKFRNQYEEVQRGRWDTQRNALDETMRKLRELARRQQTEVERARRRHQQGDGGGGDSQQALAEELDELVRQLQRLSRKRDSEPLRRSMDEMRAASQAMRRSGQAQGSDSTAASETALDRLNQAQSQLEAERPARLARQLGEAGQRAAASADEQRAIERDLKDALTSGPADEESLDGLSRRKRALSDQVRRLESDLDRLAAGAESDQPRVSTALRQAADGLREAAVAERIDQSRRRMVQDPEGQARRGEADISRELDRLSERVSAARESVGESDRQRLARGLDRMRSAVRGLQANRARLGEGAERTRRLGSGAETGLDGADLDGIALELGRRVRDLGDFLEIFPPGSDAAEDIQALIAALREHRQAGDSDEPLELIRRHDALLSLLKATERGLREKVQSQPPPISANARAEPGRGQRSMVEAYYRNLSEGGL